MHNGDFRVSVETKGEQVHPDDEWQPFRGPFSRWPRAADAILAFVLTVITLGMWMAYLNDSPDARVSGTSPGITLILVLVGNGALYWRRREPFRVHVIILSVSVLAMILTFMDGPIPALVISLYSLGRYAENARFSVGGLTAALMLVAWSELSDGESVAGSFILLLLTFTIWYVGKRIRLRGEYLCLLQERAAHLEREQAAEADKAVAQERTRIARELHDIVAHQVSLMTVQAGAAKTVAAENPAAALQAMASVEKAGRQALNELRHLVSVLRPENESDGLGPQPGRADIPHLIEELRNTGMDVTLTMDTDERELPAHVDLSIYRIVQESLTNVLKHAGLEVSAEVLVQRTARDIVITVADNGRATGRSGGSGHGIAGMRERAQLLGGSLSASPQPGGGFKVVAILPLSKESL